MLQSIEGVYRAGTIELFENPAVANETRVIVTFMVEGIGETPGVVNLRERGISPAEASSQRAALASFAEDWERPDMEVYDQL